MHVEMNKKTSSYFVGLKPFNGIKVAFYVDRELLFFSIVPTGQSLDKCYRITACRTGLRFRRDIRQNLSVSTNIAEITLYCS